MKCRFMSAMAATAAVFMISSAALAAEENTLKKAIWIEGGATPKASYSLALGTRIGPVGVKIGYGGDSDYQGSDVLDAHPFSPAELGVAATPLGQKRIDPAFGFDLGYFYDLTKNLTAYGEVGPYFQEVRKVLVVTNNLGGPASWQPGTLFNSEKKQYSLTVEGGAGLQYRIPLNPWRAVLLTAGYHTMRGVSAGVGYAF